MKKYLVIGNPIDHSLSPKLHNYWLKENNIDAIYEKKKLNQNGLKEIIHDVKEGKINGINVTVPFKKAVIPFLEELSPEAKDTQSVNTIYLQNGITVGHNTDIAGFELAIKYAKYNLTDKRIFVLGAGGVAPSIIYALRKMKVSKITLTNRTKEKAESLKKLFKDLEIIEWGKRVDFDMIINATSVGLKNEDGLNFDYSANGPDKYFYDVIYNPKETLFLKRAKLFDNKTENGKMMFIYQAHQSFTIWNKVMPKIDDETIKLI
ncbi:shikimate dehydrogenase [Candidatus Pelagibacter sp.]|nr:shikimate dehydrogenase [Candidatus Pelagibacter sp.]